MKLLLAFGLVLLPCVWAQTPGEMTTRDETAATFKAHVNLVTVPVVARDVHGVAVGNLTKENFILYDKGKPQDIVRFSVEKIGARAPLEANATPGVPLSSEDNQGHTMVVPERFVAYFFDDVHMSMPDLARVRQAAERHIAQLKPTDRAAIFTISGTPMVDFTDDKEKLRVGLSRLRPATLARAGAMIGGQLLTLGSLDAIKEAVRQMAAAPGLRTLMVVSPGFFTMDSLYIDDKNEIIDRAIRGNVIINALDVRGLYTDPALDVSRATPPRGGLGSTITRESMRSDILAEMAYGTGGVFFQNSNDFDEGFHRLAAAPEYVYLLSFTPQNLKNDGSFHTLRVSIKPSANLTLQARHGYYAPKKNVDEAETARQEIESALYSREEIAELPVELHTQFFKPDPATAKLSVLVKLQLKQFKFRKVEDRNNNEVTLVSALFDRNGHYLQGIKKVITLKLKDETLATRLGQGVTVRTAYDVTPGAYLVRMVVRDSEGQLMSASNGAVEIPR